MNKIIVIALMGAIVIAAVAGAMLYKPAETKAKIGYLPAASYSLLWVAYENGYFADEGLEITLVEFQNVGQLVTALAQGTIQGAPLTSVAIAAFSKSVDFKIVAGNSLDGTALVVHNDSNIQGLSDLQGLRVGTVLQVPGDFVFKKILQDRGINVTYSEYLTPADALIALEQNQVNASLLWEPYSSLSVYKGLNLAVWDKEIYPADYPCCLQVFSSSFAKANPELIQKFIKALIKAEVFAYARSDTSLPMVKKYMPSIPFEIIYDSVFYIDPDLGRARNPISAYINASELNSFWQLLVPSLLTQNDYNNLVSKIDLTYFQAAVNDLKSVGFKLPQKYGS